MAPRPNRFAHPVRPAYRQHVGTRVCISIELYSMQVLSRGPLPGCKISEKTTVSSDFFGLINSNYFIRLYLFHASLKMKGQTNTDVIKSKLKCEKEKKKKKKKELLVCFLFEKSILFKILENQPDSRTSGVIFSEWHKQTKWPTSDSNLDFYWKQERKNLSQKADVQHTRKMGSTAFWTLLFGCTYKTSMPCESYNCSCGYTIDACLQELLVVKIFSTHSIWHRRRIFMEKLRSGNNFF